MKSVSAETFLIPPHSFRFLPVFTSSFVTGITTTTRAAFVYKPEFYDDAHQCQMPPYGTRLRPKPAL